MFRHISFLGLSAITVLASASAAFSQQVQVLDFKPGEVVVGYRSEADRRASERLLKSDALLNSFNALAGQAPTVQVAPFRENSLLLKFSVRTGKNVFADTDVASQRRLVDDLANQIKKVDPKVKYAYPHYLLGLPNDKPVALNEKRQKQLLSATSKSTGTAPSSFPNDPDFANGLQWDYQALPMGMNAVGAWKVTTGNRKIVVAVLDTGILRLHADVVGSGNLLPGYNFVSDGGGRNSDPSDPNPQSHGSNVASIIGAVATNNNLSVAGINWAVSVLPIRVMNEAGDGSMADVADGILWAAGLPVEGVPKNETPADVINLSLRAEMPCDQAAPIKAAIDKARAAGSVVVVAAGNDSKDIAGVFPASCPGVIAVAAHDFKGRLAPYSNFGNVSIVAPGGAVDKDGNGLAVLGIGGNGDLGWSGTSQAAPHVAGAIALALAKHEDWRRNPDLIAAAVHDTAVPMPAGACSHPCGPGQLDAQRLLEYQPPAQTAPLTASVTLPQRASTKPSGIRVASASDDMSGRWLLNDGTTLLIAGEEWHHSTKGEATITVVGPHDVLIRYPQQVNVTCAYRVMAMDGGKTLHLEATNPTQPREYCPTGQLTSVGQRQSAVSAGPEAKQASKGIVGRWLMNGGGILTIAAGDWLHPNKGAADIIQDGDRLTAQYPQQVNVKCSYRMVLLDDGKALELTPTNNLQPNEYCPSGRMTAVP
jgi:subtilisin family serine protease